MALMAMWLMLPSKKKRSGLGALEYDDATVAEMYALYNSFIGDANGKALLLLS